MRKRTAAIGPGGCQRRQLRGGDSGDIETEERLQVKVIGLTSIS